MNKTIIKIEEEYTEDIINLVKEWYEEIIILSKKHQKLSNIFYIKHVIYSLPQILIPTFLIFITQLDLGYNELKVISGSGFLITGTLSGVYNFFNFNVKSQKHDNASIMYNTLKEYINTNLHRSDNYRIPSDVFVSYIRNEKKNLEKFSPSIENSCISNCCQND